MNQNDADPIDALLRKQFDGPVPDGGFSERVMRRLPARRRRNGWPLLAGVFAGAAACWLSLSSSPLLHAGWRDWMHGEFSGPALILLLAMVGMSLLALGWTLAEADDG